MPRIVFIVTLFIAVTTAQATVINVPTDQPTIQAGIDAASEGDTVLVAPGDYAEHVVFGSTSLVLLSSAGAESTFITHANGGILFPNDNGNVSSVIGFTIREATIASGIYIGTGNSPTIASCVLINNVISERGGGTYCRGSGVTIRNCHFEANTGLEGGGLAIDYADAITVDSCTFVANTGTSSAGAIYIRTSTDVTISKCVGWQNTALGGTGGGFLYACNTSQDVTILNCTVVDNKVTSSSRGAGIELYGCPNADVRNNIIAFNKGSVGVYINGSNPGLLIEYDDVYGNTSGDYTGVTPGTGSISIDPLFADTSLADFGILIGSLCINAGDPNPIYNDPDGSRNDMGAIPFVPYHFIVSLYMQGESNMSNVVSHEPTIEWNNEFDAPVQQLAFEIEIGTDDDWLVAETWQPGPITSSQTAVLYVGAPLNNGQTYYMRLRLSDGIDWYGWYHTSFRMNTEPERPILASPNNGTETGVLPKLYVDNTTDAENDLLQYEFQLFELVDPVDILLATSELIDEEADSTGWQIDLILTEDKTYLWQVRAWDGFEYSGWSLPNFFSVNQFPVAPTRPMVSTPTGEALILYEMLPEFSWTESIDPDPFDRVTYQLDISVDDAFSFVLSFEDLLATAYQMADSLGFGERYWWRVVAQDNTGLTITSDTASFWTWTLGDVNHSHDVTIGDVSLLIDHLFLMNPPIDPPRVGDLNSSCDVTIGDVSLLIDHLFISNAPLQVGCDPPASQLAAD